MAQLYISAENYKRATEVLAEAMKVSHDDADVRERDEDARIRYLRQRLLQAEKKAQASGTEADAHEVKKIRYELAHAELDNYKFLCERYPTNLTFRYELGERYRAVREYGEAIKQFQSALSDPRKRGNCLLSLAMCFQQLKKYPLAMTHFKQAVDEIPERDLVTRKDALYRAGRLALGLKDREHAEKYLTALAQLDYGYKDVEALLDKVERLGNDNPSGAARLPETGGVSSPKARAEKPSRRIPHRTQGVLAQDRGHPGTERCCPTFANFPTSTGRRVNRLCRIPKAPPNDFARAPRLAGATAPAARPFAPRFARCARPWTAATWLPPKPSSIRP